MQEKNRGVVGIRVWRGSGRISEVSVKIQKPFGGRRGVDGVKSGVWGSSQGGGRVGGGGQGECERRCEVFVKIQNKKKSGGGGSGWM